MPTPDVTVIKLVSDNVAWIASDDRIWRTADSGAHWISLSLPELKSYRIWGVYASTLINAWVFNSRRWYATSDGGTTWRIGPAVPLAHDHFITSMWFDGNLEFGWAAVSEGFDRETARSVVYRTSNGGKEWTRIALMKHSSDNPPWNLYVIDRDHIFVFLRNSLLRTADEGPT